jgi:hypothetical protein
MRLQPLRPGHRVKKTTADLHRNSRGSPFTRLAGSTESDQLAGYMSPGVRCAVVTFSRCGIGVQSRATFPMVVFILLSDCSTRAVMPDLTTLHFVARDSVDTALDATSVNTTCELGDPDGTLRIFLQPEVPSARHINLYLFSAIHFAQSECGPFRCDTMENNCVTIENSIGCDERFLRQRYLFLKYVQDRWMGMKAFSPLLDFELKTEWLEKEFTSLSESTVVAEISGMLPLAHEVQHVIQNRCKSGVMDPRYATWEKYHHAVTCTRLNKLELEADLLAAEALATWMQANGMNNESSKKAVVAAVFALGEFTMFANQELPNRTGDVRFAYFHMGMQRAKANAAHSESPVRFLYQVRALSDLGITNRQIVRNQSERLLPYLTGYFTALRERFCDGEKPAVVVEVEQYVSRGLSLSDQFFDLRAPAARGSTKQPNDGGIAE